MTEEQKLNPQKQKQLEYVIECSKSKGNISSCEIMDILDDTDCTIEQLEYCYAVLEANGIDVINALETDFLNIPLNIEY